MVGASREVGMMADWFDFTRCEHAFGLGEPGLLVYRHRLLSGSGVMGSGLVVNRLREAESLRIGPDRAVDPLVALGAEESESHGRPDQVDEPARRSEVL